MKVAVLIPRSMRGSGFATRITSMLAAYVAAGLEVHVYHYRFPHEEGLPESTVSMLSRYVMVPLLGHRFRQHASLLPALAWCCSRAHSDSDREPTPLFDVIQAETSSTWTAARALPATRRLVVLHDDDAARLRSLSRVSARGLGMAVNAVSAWKYAGWQREVLQEADRVWFVSEVERDRLGGSLPVSRTTMIPNGADDGLWSIRPADSGEPADVLFVGPGSYEANTSGLAWFMDAVWPRARERVPHARVRVVGVGWDRYPRHPDASFVGWRESLVDEYSQARVVIAPLFAGGGTKLKVVEAMAAARPVVATPSGAEGLPTSEGLRVAEDPVVFAAEVARFVSDARAASDAGLRNRRAVDGFRWSAVWSRAIEDLESLVGREDG